MDLDECAAAGKKALKSKTIWLGIILIGAGGWQLLTGQPVEQAAIDGALGFVLIGLRAVTKEPISW